MNLDLILILVGVGLIMEAAFWDISRHAGYCLTAGRQDSLPADLAQKDDEEPDPAAEPSDLPLG